MPTVAVSAGRYQDAVEACQEARSMLDEQACTGLAAGLLSLQAKAHMARRQYSSALECVQEALALQPGHVPALLVRSQVWHYGPRIPACLMKAQSCIGCSCMALCHVMS